MIIVNLDVMLARRKMSMTELSQRVGITMANLSILKNGKSKAIRLSTLDAICTVLDCQPGEILEWAPTPAVQLPEATAPIPEMEEAPQREERAKPRKAPAPRPKAAKAGETAAGKKRSAPKPEPVYRTVATRGVRLNLRDRGSRSGAVVGRLNDGTRVELLESEGQWAHIRAEERDGWVLALYLQ